MKVRVNSTTPKVRERTPTDDFVSRVENMTHEQMVEAYRSTKPGDPWGDFLGWAISQQKVGETPAERDKRIGKGPVSTVPKGYSALSGFSDVSNYGFADEASAALDALLGRRTYEQGLANARLQAREARDTNPKSYTGGQVAGGVPLAAQAALVMPATSSMGGMMLAGAAEGAAQGGLYGFGSGEGAQDRLWQSIEQALIGAGIGGAAPVVGRGIGAAYRAGKNAIQNASTTRKATQSILQMLQDNNIPLDRARAALSRMGGEGTMADISPGMQVEAAGTAAASPAAAEKMSPRFAGRQDRAPARVGALLDDSMGPFKDPQAIADEVTKLKKSAGPAYRAAEEYVIDANPVLAEIEQQLKTYPKGTPIGDELIKWRAQIQPERGRMLERGHLLHGFKKQIRDAADAAFAGKQSALGTALNAVKKKADEVLKTQIPNFKQADEIWSGAQGVEDAFEYGQQKLLGSDVYPGQHQKMWDDYTPAQKTAARSGTRAKLEMSQSGAPQPGLRLERQLEKNMNDLKVGPMVEEYKPGAYRKLKSDLDNETTWRETNDLIQATRGSRTTPVMLAAQNRWGMKPGAEGLSNALGNAATAGAVGGPGAALVSLAAQGAGAGAKGLFNWLKTANPKTIQMAGDMLSRQGPEARGVLQEVIKVLRSNGATKAQADAIARAVTAIGQGQAAYLSGEIRSSSPIGGSAGRR